MMIDTLKLARSLQRHGFTQQQAEGLAEGLRDTVAEGLATKADIDALRVATKADIAEVKADIDALRVETTSAIDALRVGTKADLAAVKADMKDLENTLIKWIVGVAFAAVALALTIAKLLP
jgi:Protein of unknown function (DUF1640)